MLMGKMPVLLSKLLMVISISEVKYIIQFLGLSATVTAVITGIFLVGGPDFL